MENREFLKPTIIPSCSGRSQNLQRKIPPRKIGSLEKFLVPNPPTSSAHPRGIVSNHDPKIIPGHHFQPKEMHTEILLNRPGPSTATPVEFRSAVLSCPPPRGLPPAMIPTKVPGTVEETMLQRGSRDPVSEILSLLSGYNHGIPYPITKYYLESTGFNNFSPEIVQFVGLTAQKYIYDILCEALRNCKERIAREKAERGDNSTVPITMTLTDLLPALKKYKENKK